MAHDDINSLQTIDLADKINEAIDKINENFHFVEDSAGLSQEEVIALIQQHSGGGLTIQQIRDALKDNDLDIGTGKILYSNHFPNKTELDKIDPATYHGMFAHTHDNGAAYFSHGNEWVRLARYDELGDGGSGPSRTPFPATIYTRSSTQPDTPHGGTFDFDTGTLTVPTTKADASPLDKTWTEEVPSGSAKLWISNYTFVDDNANTNVIEAEDWSVPAELSSGIVDQNNGELYAQLTVYRRFDTDETVVKPSGGSFNFDPTAADVFVVPTGWYSVPPSVETQAGDLYVASGIATTNGLADGETIDTTIDWGQPIKTSTGLNGDPGKSLFQKVVYRKVPRPADYVAGEDLDRPYKPDGGYFNFGTEVFGPTDANGNPAALGPLPDVSGTQGVWYAGIPDGEGDLWSSTYVFSTLGDTGTSYVPDDGWSTPTLGIQQSISTYKKSLYTRSNSTPTAIDDNNNVVYSFTNDGFVKEGGKIQGAPDWYEEIPPLDLTNRMDLWETTTTASIVGAIGVDNTLTFSAPKRILNFATDSQDGYSFLQINVYQWHVPTDANPTPDTPTDGNFDFSDSTLLVPSGWSRTISDQPSADHKLFVSSGVASTKPSKEGDPDPVIIDDDIAWSSPDETTAGGAGRDGRSTFRAVIVQRSTAANGPTSPTGGMVNFASTAKTKTEAQANAANITLPDGETQLTIPANSLIPPDGWYDTVAEIPDGEGKIWAVEQTFAIDGDDDVDVGSTWSDPYLDHNNGEDGYSTFSAQIYTRAPADSSPVPAPPSTLLYSFTNDRIEVSSSPTNIDLDSANIGWSESMQPSNEDGDALWMCRATATNRGLVGEDASLSWSTAVIVSTDGVSPDPSGSATPRQSSGYLYFQGVSVNAPADTPVMGADGTTTYSAKYIFFGGGNPNGGFSGLNPKWSETPYYRQGDADISGNLWAVRWQAMEEMSGGTGTGEATVANNALQFSPAFANYSFDGVVTFTNSEGALTQDESGNTIIDGSYIQTGTIDATKVQIQGLTVNPNWNDIDVNTNAQGERIVMTSEKIEVYSASDSGAGVLRVKLGKL